MVLWTTDSSSNRNIIRGCGLLHLKWILLYCYGYKGGGVYWAAVALLYDLLGNHAPKIDPVGCIWWEGSGLSSLLLRSRLDPDETWCLGSFIIVDLLVIVLPSALPSVAIFSALLCIHRNIGCTMAIVTWSGLKDDLLVRGVCFASFIYKVRAFLRYVRLAFGLGMLAELTASDLCNADLLHKSFLRMTFEGGHISSRLSGLPLSSAPLVQIRCETVRVVYHQVVAVVRCLLTFLADFELLYFWIISPLGVLFR